MNSDENREAEEPARKGAKGRLAPKESASARAEQRALETLVTLLDSEDESIRLKAALGILERPTHAKEPPMPVKVVKKITGRG